MNWSGKEGEAGFKENHKRRGASAREMRRTEARVIGSGDRGEKKHEVFASDSIMVNADARSCARACADLVPQVEAMVNTHLLEIQSQIQSQLGPLLERLVQDVGNAERDIAAAQALCPELARLDAFLDQVTNMRRAMMQDSSDE